MNISVISRRRTSRTENNNVSTRLCHGNSPLVCNQTSHCAIAYNGAK